MTGTRLPIRLGIVDSDSAFLRVLTHRLERAGWQQRVLGSPVSPDALVAMRLDALVIDRRAARPGAAARRRRLDQQAMSPGGAAGPRGGRRAAAPAG